jgi:hypothetical protein
MKSCPIYDYFGPGGIGIAATISARGRSTRFKKLFPASLHSSAKLESLNGCLIDSDTKPKIASLISIGAWGIKPSSAEEIRKRLADMAVSEKPAKEPQL